MRQVALEFVERGWLPDNLYLSEYVTRADVKDGYVETFNAGDPHDWRVLQGHVERRTSTKYPIKTGVQRSALLDVWFDSIIRD